MPDTCLRYTWPRLEFSCEIAAIFKSQYQRDIYIQLDLESKCQPVSTMHVLHCRNKHETIGNLIFRFSQMNFLHSQDDDDQASKRLIVYI